jgi:hypothetical protein
MNREHYVLIAPGLNGRVDGIDIVTKSWPNRFGLRPESIPIPWKDDSHFYPHLTRITERIDELTKQGHKVSLIGTSAGGSAMLNAFLDRKRDVYKVVNICGFSLPVDTHGPRSFINRGKTSLAFRESVKRFDKSKANLTAQDLHRIMTVRSLMDELVPPSATQIEGAINKRVYMVEHIASIAVALMFYEPAIKFLTD